MVSKYRDVHLKHYLHGYYRVETQLFTAFTERVEK